MGWNVAETVSFFFCVGKLAVYFIVIFNNNDTHKKKKKIVGNRAMPECRSRDMYSKGDFVLYYK
jgi:hypothetical protein